jgi:outer membrane protein assembly factor BamB
MTNPVGSGTQEVCPACGAPKQNKADVKCGYCGAILRADRPEPATTFPSYVKAAGRQYVWSYVLAGVVVAIGMAVQVFRTSAVSKSVTSTIATTGKRPVPAQPESMRISEPIATLGKGDRDGDVLCGTYKNELILVDASAARPRWKSEAFARGLTAGNVFVGADVAYVVDETRVVAISVGDGKTLWQAPLVAEVSYGGRDALMLAERTFLVLQRDGSLQAFDRATGSPAWNTKLEYRPSGFPRVGNRIVVLRPESGKRKEHYTVDLVDATTGKTQRTLHIQNHDLVFHQLATPDAKAKFLFSEDGRELYVIYGFWDLCAERWNLDDGTMVWQSRRKGTNSADTFLLTEQALLVFTGREVRSIARANGAAHTLLEDKDNTFRPLVGQNSVVVVFATPSWDSRQATLWGVDAGTGKQLWSAALPKEALSASRNAGDDLVRVTRNGIAVVQLVAGKQIAVDLLDLKTGVSPGRKSAPLPEEADNLHIAADGDQAWFKARGDLYSVNLVTGKLAYHFH